MTILAGFDSPIGVPTAHSLASGLARWFLAIRVSLDRASLRRVDIHLNDRDAKMAMLNLNVLPRGMILGQNDDLKMT